MFLQRHPDGVVSVTYKEAEEADLCVSSLHQRWFAKRRILAATWDGQTKYEVQETDKQREERLQKWENFLETGKKEAQATVPGVDVQNTASEPKSNKGLETTIVNTNTVDKHANANEIESKTALTESKTALTESTTALTETVSIHHVSSRNEEKSVQIEDTISAGEKDKEED